MKAREERWGGKEESPIYGLFVQTSVSWLTKSQSKIKLFNSPKHLDYLHGWNGALRKGVHSEKKICFSCPGSSIPTNAD